MNYGEEKEVQLGWDMPKKTCGVWGGSPIKHYKTALKLETRKENLIDNTL